MPQGSPKRIFLDDIRDPPIGNWILARTAHDFIERMVQHRGNVTVVALDHDLEFCAYGGGGYNSLTFDGTWVARWMVKNNMFPSDKIYVHSMNHHGAERMVGILAGASEAKVIRISYDDLKKLTW